MLTGSLTLTDHVMIVLRKDDAMQLAERHRCFADEAGIAILRCAEDGGEIRYRAVETPGPLPRPYDLDAPEFTIDMAETIKSYFDGLQSEGELLVESTARGLWFVLPWGQRLFIGLARLHAGPPESERPQIAAELEQSGNSSCAPLRPR